MINIKPQWVELRVKGHYMGRFDPSRGLLELRTRGTSEIFDLAEMTHLQSDKKHATIKQTNE